ncbi:MAG: SDR family NAD(P)-dependent oxidoreductase [Thermoleophilia bacterium]|nr:SDR family NAD(P)-dependent oxidoreductase [Thermoleophilia bacterium]
MTDLMNDHVLVIGAGPGLGASIAREAAARGARVTVIARTASTVDPLVTELSAAGADVEARCADAAHEPVFRVVLEQVVADRGAPSLCVYNAVDPTPLGKPTELSPELLTVGLETNVTGALVAVQSLLGAIRERDGGGTIILTGGVLATKPFAGMAALSIGKAAIRTLALCLHQELGADDPVNIVTVTIGGTIRAGGAFDPTRIAARFLEVHTTRERGEKGEISYRGDRG